MPEHVLVWDLETVPDLQAVARVHGLQAASDPEARDALGDKFPKLPSTKSCALVLCWPKGKTAFGVPVR
jgi:hypothetical protein